MQWATLPNSLWISCSAGPWLVVCAGFKVLTIKVPACVGKPRAFGQQAACPITPKKA